MAVTGTGTQADPFIVHSYTEFISLSNHAAVADSSVYIQFFDDEHPNQTINCNSYGSEFKWGQFVGKADVTTYINLNGCTIKNFLIDSDDTMFYAIGYNDTMPRWHAAKIEVSNGSIRNVFMASASSKLIYGEVTLHDVSISMNTAGTTAIPISGIGSGKSCYMDNCALYLVCSTLSTSIMRYMIGSDTDIELHITDQNQIKLFPDCSFTDCRVQGKISGTSENAEGNNRGVVLGVLSSNYASSLTQWTNCVFDVDLTEINTPSSFQPLDVIYSFSTGINTNVICNSHYPTGKTPPSVWNYMSHENIRNGTHLNNAGFTVVEVVGS